MKIIQISPASFAANSYLLASGGEAIIIDPSVSLAAIERTLTEETAKLCGIILTHGHFDHTISVDTVRSEFNVPLMIHEGDAPMLTNGLINGFYDFFGKECTHQKAERLLRDKEKILLGNETLEIFSTPGHSPGSICLRSTDDDGKDFFITGDTLFANSIGRCDLWQGNEEQMKASISLLSSFDESLMIYPGHGAPAPLSDALRSARFYIDF